MALEKRGPSLLEAREYYNQNKSLFPQDIIEILEREGEWRDHYGNHVIFGTPNERVEICIRKSYPDYQAINHHINDYRNYLKTLSTHDLMSLKRACYRTGGWYQIFEYGGPSFDIDEVKAELATREHIPNKHEKKILRREAAQGKRKSHKLDA